MMLLNFMLAALSVAGVIAAPVRTDAVPSPPSLEVSTTRTAVPTTVTQPTRSVPTSVWQHGRRAVNYDNVRPLSHPAGLAAPAPPPFPTGGKAIDIRAVTNSVGGVATVTLPLPTTTTPTVHVHRADVTPEATVPDGCLDDEVDADTDATAAVLPRMLALPINFKGVPHPHATTTFNSIRARQLLLPTILFNAAAAAKVTPA